MKRHDAQITVRLPGELTAELTRRAKENTRTKSEEVREILARSLRASAKRRKEGNDAVS